MKTEDKRRRKMKKKIMTMYSEFGSMPTTEEGKKILKEAAEKIRPLKIVHVYHTGASIGYYHRVLSILAEKQKILLEMIRLDHYVTLGRTPSTDVLSYQTFPDEKHKGKFNPRLVSAGDSLFQKFEGLKIISDAHDCSDADAFSRFSDSKELPRVKCFPSKWFLENYNVIMIAGIATTDSRTFPDEFDRVIEISCKFGRVTGDYYFHRIRESVVEQLETFFPNRVDFKQAEGNRKVYTEELRHTLISIGAPGWGPFSGSYHCALRAGALLFAHISLNDIQYLPHANLVDGEDYISYDLYNFNRKLKRLLDDPKKIELVRKSGRAKFAEGFDYSQSADKLWEFIKENVKR